MRHKNDIKRLGRSAEHRLAMLAGLLCGLIERRRITTTLIKAKVTQRAADALITRARVGTLSAKRHILGSLRSPRHVEMLLNGIVPKVQQRTSGFTRIIRLGKRMSDSSEMVLLEWVDVTAPERKKKEKTEKKSEAQDAKKS